MLKKIQRRFIVAAMAAFSTVMLLIIAGINMANYCRTTSMQDYLVGELLLHEQTDPAKPAPPPLMGEIPGRDSEAAFMTRFFTVHCDADGKVREVLREYISTVDEETAKAYAQDVLSRGREKGYYENYRYLVSRNEKGISVLFLNAAI